MKFLNQVGPKFFYQSGPDFFNAFAEGVLGGDALVEGALGGVAVRTPSGKVH